MAAAVDGDEAATPDGRRIPRPAVWSRPPMTESYEEEQRVLDSHRREEQNRAREEIEDQLRSRGIKLHATDGDEEIEDLLDAIERFEEVVESHGGDLMVDRIGSSEPSN